MAIYREIYEKRFGPIPLDEEGRTFEIHHKDGNRKNNDIDNLQCVTIREHYDIHYRQGDWGACLAISMRMKLSPKEISKMQSEIGRKSALERKSKGTNTFCYTGEKHHRYGKKHTEEAKEKIRAKRAKQIISVESYAKASATKTGKKRTEEQRTKMSEIAIERNRTTRLVTCPHCSKIGPKPQMNQWHFDKCKHRSEDN